MTSYVHDQASIALSDSLTQSEENEGRIFPDVGRIRDVSFKVAVAVLEQAFREDLIQVGNLHTLRHTLHHGLPPSAPHLPTEFSWRDASLYIYVYIYMCVCVRVLTCAQ